MAPHSESKTAPDGTAYDVTGSLAAPAIVLIHGLGLSRKLWDAHLAAFRNFCVIRYDLPGHGGSTPASVEVNLCYYANQIAGLLDHLEIDRVHIVGFSIGGMINRRFAMDFPRRVRSLVILNSPHDRGEEVQKQVEERAQAARDQGPLATIDAALERWFTPDYPETGEARNLVRQWRGQADASSYAGAAWVLADGVRELVAPVPPITAPALVMTCENDAGSTPAMSQDIASEIPGAKTIIVPRLRHLGLLEDAEAFTEPVVAFLREVGLSGD